jgi:hypothetical protein
MAVQIKYHNIIIPISRLNKLEKINKLSKFLKHCKKGKIRNVWHDDDLVAIGRIMSPHDVELLVNKLTSLGLRLLTEKDSFEDMCIIDFVNGPNRDCSWLEYKLDPWDISYVWLKGKKANNIIKIPTI